MPSILKMLPMLVRQNVGKQQLERKPEPSEITSDQSNVDQYDRVMETKLAISYAIAIETIYRARTEPFGGKALDLCCGPGHLAITMAKHLKLDQLIGVDLSEPMIEVASKNATKANMQQVSFRSGNATKLDTFESEQFDLCTMMDAAHHLPTLSVVTDVLREMDRVTRLDGLVVVMDLVRLRSKTLTDLYVNTLASDYAERGLPNFLEDFRNSMFAAWTPEELASTVPTDTSRKWKLVVPRGLPFAQFLIGLPKERDQVFLKRDKLWKKNEGPVCASDRGDYAIARLTMSSATIKSCG